MPSDYGTQDKGYGVGEMANWLSEWVPTSWRAVYTADSAALSAGVLTQNSSPDASWQYALQYQKNGSVLFSVDGAGKLVGSGAYFGGVDLNGDTANGSIDVGN